MTLNFCSAKTVRPVLVKINGIFNEEAVTRGGHKILIDPTWMKTENVVRMGEVVCEPAYNNIGVKAGDLVVFHPNQIKPTVFKDREVYAIGEFIKAEGLYLIEQSEIYAIQRGDEFIPVEPNCFVLPYYDKKYKDDLGISIPEELNNIETAFFGVMKHTNKQLSEIGVNNGDLVSFNDFSKHRFVIGGEMMFRMRTFDLDSVVK